MRSLLRLALPLALAAVLALPAVANAQTTVSSGITRLAGYPGQTGVTNSDVAIWGNRMYTGTYAGFRIFDISNPAAPAELINFRCTASTSTALPSQGDVTVWGNLLFRSVDTPQTTSDCSRTNAPTVGGLTPGWEGVEIFDVSNPLAPVQVKAVATDCGSHTNTLIPDLANNRILLYVSSYPLSGLYTSNAFGTSCQRPHDKISIIQVPLNGPASASVLRTVTLNLPDSYLTSNATSPMRGCHDISVFLPLDLAAGACVSQGIIMDISDPANPTVQNRLVNPDIDNCGRNLPSAPANPLCLWHSATFTWDGKYMVFGDEAGGGGSGECASDDPAGRGAFWMHRVSNPTFPISRFKTSRIQPSQQNCTAHLMNFVPINGRYVLPTSWYSGGTGVVNWNSQTNPFEFAWYEIDPPVVTGTDRTNTWTTYWYNGYMYTLDNGTVPGGNRGLEVLQLNVPWAAYAWELPRYNPQTQENLIRCRAMAHGQRPQAGRSREVHVQVRVLGNQAVVGTRVLLRGVGVRAQGLTDEDGDIMFDGVRPRRAGTLRVVVPDVRNMLGCNTSRRVRAAAGTAGSGAGGGAGLTGRPR